MKASTIREFLSNGYKAYGRIHLRSGLIYGYVELTEEQLEVLLDTNGEIECTLWGEPEDKELLIG